MNIVQSDLQNRHPPVSSAYSYVLGEPEGLLENAWRKAEGEPAFHLPYAVLDPKAMRMLEVYTHPWWGYGWEKWRTHAHLLAWRFQTYLHQWGKRGLDLLIALCALPFVLPVMLVTAIAIKIDSPGPAIFKQERVGKWGRRFTCLKFRSMCIQAEAWKAELMAMNEADEVVFKIKRDPRVTRVGRIIRKMSIDELPQIYNVIKGEMSFIGPRPPLPGEVESYQFDTYRRLDTIPGITGLQQISGRSDLSFKRWVELDIEYIQNQSLKKDIEILFKTIPAVITGRGAY